MHSLFLRATLVLAVFTGTHGAPLPTGETTSPFLHPDVYVAKLSQRASREKEKEPTATKTADAATDDSTIGRGILIGSTPSLTSSCVEGTTPCTKNSDCGGGNATCYLFGDALPDTDHPWWVCVNCQ